MKAAACYLAACGLAHAIVLPAPWAPKDNTESVSVLDTNREKSGASFDHEASWWDHLLQAGSHVHSAIGEATDPIASKLDDILEGTTDSIKHAYAEGSQSLEEVLDGVHDTAADVFGFAQDSSHGGGRHGHHDWPNLTAYQLLSKSHHASKFFELVNEHDDLIELLNSTSAGNVTVFVPTNEAFDRIPDDHKKHKPSKEVLNSFLRYHIGVGSYPALRVLHTHTLPTALDEPMLGNKPQRLRTSLGLGGVKVNFYSRVVAVDFGAKNGVLHAINTPLVPPFFTGKNLALYPSGFSTLLYAFDKTDFISYIHHVKLQGSTVFAPSNIAFARLGPKANAFLFNTEAGLKYLKALLKYHITPNATLYSDAYYDAGEDESQDQKHASSKSGVRHQHLDLPTLLGEKSVAVDVARWGGWIRMRLNGYVPVIVQDGISKNGVIQVVGRVLIPPHKHHDGSGSSDDLDDIEVDDLKARLEDYLDKGSEHDKAEVEL